MTGARAVRKGETALLSQASDFQDESDTLHALVAPLDEAGLEQSTQFKGWTIEDVIRHLHFWNRAADLALSEPEAFKRLYADAAAHLGRGGTLGGFEIQWLQGLGGQDLVRAWAETYAQVAERFGAADPKGRVVWAGPDMSARSCISARMMETWAHGQEVFDCLGQVRHERDRIKNVVVLGVNTFEWSFKVRKQTPPGPMPRLRLTAPSGAVWTWGDDGAEEKEAAGDLIAGSAVDFARVVTQVRNVADTGLTVTGPCARAWMASAQCFAGPPETPPAPGTRYRRDAAA